MISITEIFYYPVKSCRGISVDAAELSARGITGDREFMLVDDAGVFLTQREEPGLALIDVDCAEDNLVFSAPAMPTLKLSPANSGDRLTVQVWQDPCTGIDQGNAIADWFSDYLGRTCRLVKFADEEPRYVSKNFSQSTNDQIAFSDGFPLLLISAASLADLNRRLKVPVPVERFRPNIVISGSEPYAEDSWDIMKTGDVALKVAKPCARCVITTIDPSTGESGKEPLRTLADYRRSEDGKVNFGQNLIHLAAGTIKIGDRISVTMR
jgi:uncharacterized protein YcbX